MLSKAVCAWPSVTSCAFPVCQARFLLRAAYVSGITHFPESGSDLRVTYLEGGRAEAQTHTPAMLLWFGETAPPFHAFVWHLGVGAEHCPRHPSPRAPTLMVGIDQRVWIPSTPTAGLTLPESLCFQL